MFIQEEFMRVRQKEILDEADRRRLISRVKYSPGRSKIQYAKVMTWIGGIFLNLGTSLTERFADKTIIAESGIRDNCIQGTH